MPKSLRCFLKGVAVAGHLGAEIAFLKPVLDLRLRHDAVHEPLPQTVESVGATALLDLGHALPRDEQRLVP